MLLFLILNSSFLIHNCFSQWSQIATINSTELRGVKFFNEWTGIAVGVGGIWRSTNSGVNWTQVLSGVNMNSVSFPDINTGYAVGDSGKIFKCTNSGITWSAQFSYIPNDLYSVSFYDMLRGFAVGQNGAIVKTTNGGLSWIFYQHSLNENFNCVLMLLDYQSAFVVGSVNSEIFCGTINGGINWSCSMNYPGNNLKSVAYNSSGVTGIFLAVGSNGRVRRSTNFGVTWNLINTGHNLQLNQVLYTTTDSAYIVGNSGLVIVTSNTGLNWSQQGGTTGNNLFGLSFINNQTGWAVGGNGIVLRKGILVGITKIGNSVPKEFKLYQNYPNPFNPATKIRFDVARNNSHVVLEIYDLLGREVKNLVNNEIKDAGRYSVEFDMTNYASGVYFFRIEAGTFVQAKKMVLVK